MEQGNYNNPYNTGYNSGKSKSDGINIGMNIGIIITILIVFALLTILFILMFDRDRKLKLFIDQTNIVLQAGYQKDLQQNAKIQPATPATTEV